jgi:hypothetical protein
VNEKPLDLFLFTSISVDGGEEDRKNDSIFHDHIWNCDRTTRSGRINHAQPIQTQVHRLALTNGSSTVQRRITPSPKPINCWYLVIVFALGTVSVGGEKRRLTVYGVNLKYASRFVCMGVNTRSSNEVCSLPTAASLFTFFSTVLE